MVHHSEKIIQIIETNPRNPLANIPLFSDKNLLRELKQLVQTKASIKIPRVTGIPPHVNMIVSLQDLIDKNAKEADERKKQFERMGEIVSEKLEAIAADNGTLTRSSVTEILAKEFGAFKEDIKKSVRDSLGMSSAMSIESNQEAIASEGESTTRDGAFTLFSYSGKFHQVPRNFIFPEDVTRFRAWRLWLVGMDYLGKTRIRPFRKFQTKLLPNKELKTQYNNEWKPIMSKMERTPGLVIPDDVGQISNAFINLSFNQATEYLKGNVCGFIWTKYRNHEPWTVGTWSTKTLPNQIRKFGTEQDKASLPIPTYHNRPHREKRTVQRRETDRIQRRKQLIRPEK